MSERAEPAVSEDRDLEVEVARLRRELAEVSGSCQARDELMSVAAHALRTPLTAILGWINLLRAGELDAATADRAIDTIERNARRQADLIADLVDATRILAGRLRLNRARVDLGRVMDAALAAIRADAEAKQVRMNVVLDPAAPPLGGDPDRLQQVVSILLSNAVKFTGKGGRIDVRLERTAAGVEVRVQDDGAGIPAAALPHLFDRLPLVASGPGEGDRSGRGRLGLGLAIARHLAELHGGGLSAASEGPGRGATFTLRLPLRGAAEEGRTEEPAPGPRSPRLDGLRVLVVADPAGGDAMVRTLGERGADVGATGTSEEALRELVAFAPDAMIVDLDLCAEDGCELVRRVRALGPEDGGQTPALALTAHAGADDRLRTLRAGFQIHVAKPVPPLELAALVASLAAQAPRRTGDAGGKDRDGS